MFYYVTDVCPGRPELLPTQGEASDWLSAQTAKYVTRLRLAEERMRGGAEKN
jgi:uncharacterized membrane protein